MNKQQTAALLAVATTYWPNINRNTDTAAMVSAWAKSLRDVPYEAAERAVVELSRRCDFPPSVKLIVDEAAKHTAYRTEMNWLMRLAWERYTELGIPLPGWFSTGVRQLGSVAPREYRRALSAREEKSC